MATFTSFGNYDWFSPGNHSWYGPNNITFLSGSPGLIIYNYDDGTQLRIVGAFANVGPLGFDATSVTEILHTSSSGTTLESISGGGLGAGRYDPSVLFAVVMAGNDVFTGSAGRDAMADGSGGNDTFTGGAGADRMFGTGGDDVFVLNAGDYVAGEYIDGGGGNGGGTNELRFVNAGVVDLNPSIGSVLNIHTFRFLSGVSDVRNVNTATGITKVIGSAQVDSIELYGSFSNDFSFLTFENWTDGFDRVTIRGDQGVLVVGTSMSDTITSTVAGLRLQANGGGGNDTMIGGTAQDELSGGIGNDALYGGDNNDALYGGDNNDLLLGQAGFDQLEGQGGNDSLYGGDNNDFVLGGIGSDYLDGQGENDALYGGDNNDTVVGNIGDDYLDGQGENDELYGNDGRDIMVGNLGNDYLDGGDGRDELYGNDNNDILIGNLGDDYLDGQGETDTLYGNQGNDTLYGNVGNDQLWGGIGADSLIGGLGDDQFRFALGDLQVGVRDVIADFAEAGGNADLLVFFGVAAGAVTTAAAGGGTLVSIAIAGGTAEILVQGFTPAQLADQIFYL